jgi:hypothetical protein
MPEVRREVCAACRIGETHKGTFKCRSKIPVAILPISFLSKDEGMAAALYQRLSEELQVFFYPRNQEELQLVYRREIIKHKD